MAGFERKAEASCIEEHDGEIVALKASRSMQSQRHPSMASHSPKWWAPLGMMMAGMLGAGEVRKPPRCHGSAVPTHTSRRVTQARRGLPRHSWIDPNTQPQNRGQHREGAAGGD
jgi:hypothetical protein